MAGLLMAVNCSTGPCVQVYTDPLTHQVIITANQNTPGSAPLSKPKSTHTSQLHPKPTVSKPYKPRPRTSTGVPYKSRPVPNPTYRPITRKVRKKQPVISHLVTAAISLSDQVSKLLPGSQLKYQPSNDPIAGIPVYFWSDSNPLFQIATAILGINVSVTLQPSFLWNFGDGTLLTTGSTGGAFPDSTITHLYKEPGNYPVTLTISWAGSWVAQGQILPVLGGAIVQTMTSHLLVSPGPTNYTD